MTRISKSEDNAVAGAATSNGTIVLGAASILSAVLGSVHAFSVFIAPLEVQFGASRAVVSLAYSLALVMLTVAVLLGHRAFGRWPAPVFVMASAALAVAGAVVAGCAGSIWGVWLGYSVMFGAANGLGYGFGLQIAAQANPGREGMAMGVVTAAYALGAVVAPGAFARALETGGFQAAMLGLAVVLAGAGLVSSWMMQAGRAVYRAAARQGSGVDLPMTRFGLLWLGYFGGVMAGLMVIGHAAAIAALAAPKTAAWVAPAVIAVCNLAGSLAAGRMADRIPAIRLLTGLPVLTVLALVGVAGWSSGGVLVFLGLAGFAYGGTIAAYPSVIAKRFGPQGSAIVYGRVFTAWGCAGLAGPWLAGAMFDATGAYDQALWVAAAIGGCSVAAAGFVFRPAAWRDRAEA